VATLAQSGLAGLAWGRVKIAAVVVLAVTVAVGGGAVFRVLAEKPAAAGSDSAAPKKGRKTLEDRLDGLPPQRQR
jgi:hypothetical protein